MTRENLLTKGGEFNLPNGTNYKGKYHVHVSKGAMVGAEHSLEYHDSLTPANVASAKKLIAIMNELQEKRRAPRRRPSRRQIMSQRTNTPTSRRAPSRPARSRTSSRRRGSGGGGGY